MPGPVLPLAEQLPALMLTDTACFRNPRYLADRDTPDRLDYRRMAEIVRMVWGLTRAVGSRSLAR